MPFQCRSLDELIAFHDLRFANGTYLYDEVRELAEEVRRELAPHMDRPMERLADEEAYTVFCLNGPLKAPDGSPIPAEDWLLTHRREVAALLIEEPNPASTSPIRNPTESTGRYLQLL